MRIDLLTVGSRGDVQPAIALGIGLKKAGFAVRMVAFENYRTLVEGYGLSFFPVSANIQELMNPMLVGMGESGAAVFRIVPELIRMFRRLFSQMTMDFWHLCQDCDALISNTATAMPAAAVAEKLGIPVIETGVFPGWPTRSFPSIFWPWPSRLETHPGWLRGIFNLATYLPARMASALALVPVMRQCRKEVLGLTGKSAARPDAPYLSGYSQEVIPRPADWKTYIHVTGYWVLDIPDHKPSEALQSFLDAGPAPVYAGFGSMPSQDPGKVTKTVLQALELTGQRGVLFSGQGPMGDGMALQDSHDLAHFVDSVPHDWLFPRMAAVVHHGGSGTTAAGMRAGRPSIVVPFAADQLLWGRRVQDLGVGPRPIPRKKLSAERLAQAITEAIGNPTIQQKASELGERLRAEDGVGRAVEIIRQYLQG